MIHDTVIIRGNVDIGENVTIEPYAIITGPCVIGDDVYIGAHAMIGGSPQHRGTYPSGVTAPIRHAGISVKRGACVREYATVHHGIVEETHVGEDALVMAGCHVAHDCQIGARATLGSFSILGGFTIIDQDVTFGQGVVTHPWAIIGEAAMVGLNSSIVKDVTPFAKVAGAPARVLGSNRHKDPSLPDEYDELILGTDVWDRWNEALQFRLDMKHAFRSVA
jgi:UDP-N-acetylglucosamine acyltransferase